MSTSEASYECVQICPHHCSVQGGERILLTFSEAVPEASVFLLFRGSDEHCVPTERNGSAMLHAIIPAHSLAETVELSVCCRGAEGEWLTLHKTQFSYTLDEKQFLAELLKQSRAGECGIPSQNNSSLSLPQSTDDLRAFDRSLTEALQTTDLPAAWNLASGDDGVMEAGALGSVKDFSPKETLLHFAARHSLNSLARHLLSLPGSQVAAVLPNAQGKLPLDLARESSNEGLVQLLTLFVNRNVDSPAASPIHRSTTAPDRSRCYENGDSRGGLSESTERPIPGPCEEVNCHMALSGPAPSPAYQVSTLLPPTAPPPSSFDSAPSFPKRHSVAVVETEFFLFPLNGRDAVTEAKGGMVYRRPGRSSWSWVIGKQRSRSVDTGLNELCRIADAEKLLQHEAKLAVKDDSTTEHLQVPGALYLAPDMTLMCSLSASCPLLNDYSQRSGLGVIVSTATSPGLSSTLSEEDHDEVVDIFPASSPRFFLSGDVSTEPSEENLAFGDVGSSSNSQSQEGGVDKPGSAPLPSVMTNYISRSEEGEEEEEEDTLKTGGITSMKVDVATSHNDSGREDADGEFMMATLSAPELWTSNVSELGILGGIDENAALVPSSGAVQQRLGEVQSADAPSPENHSGGDKESATTPPPFEGGRSSRGTSTQDDTDSSAFPWCPADRKISTPVNTTVNKGRSHRRSLSTSEVEVASPTAVRQQESVREDPEAIFLGSTASWKSSLPLSSASMDHVQQKSSQSLSSDLSGAATASDGATGLGEFDERSRASSLFTNESSSFLGSDGSDDCGSQHYFQQVSETVSTQESVESGASETAVKVAIVSAPVEEVDASILRTRQRNKRISATNRISADHKRASINSESSSDEEGGLSRLDSGARRVTVNFGPHETQAKNHNAGPDNHHLSPPSASPQADHKLSVASMDSVFEHDLTLSDVDVKVASDDQNFGQNSSYTNADFFKESGSPKVLKRRRRPPLFPRRATIAETTVTAAAKPSRRGLTKAEVGPTIQTLRGLMGSPEMPHIGERWSDDSDSTIGPSEPLPHRPVSVDPPQLACAVQRAGSAASESDSPKSAHSSEHVGHASALRESSAQSAPSSPPRSKSPGGDSLKQLPQSHHPVSPLSYKARMPLGSITSLSADSHTRSPSPSHSEHAQPVAMVSVSQRLVHPKRHSETPPRSSVKEDIRKLRPSMSMDTQRSRSSPEPPVFDSKLIQVPEAELETSLDNPASFTSSQEGFLAPEAHPRAEMSVTFSSDSLVCLDPPKRGVKNLLRGAFTRGSKNKVKAMKIQRYGSNTVVARGTATNEDPLPLIKMIRPKSAKPTMSTQPKFGQLFTDSKLDDEFMAVAPSEYLAESSPMLSTNTETAPFRPRGKQTFPNSSTNFKKADASELPLSRSIQRRDSDSSLTLSPTSAAPSDSALYLSPLEELSIVRPPLLSRSSTPPPPPSAANPPESTPASDSEPEEASQELVRTLSITHSYPELAVQDEHTWDRTVDRRVYKRLSKGERERQAIIHELILTERHHLRALKVLQLVFRQNLREHIPAEALDDMFPEVDELVEISEGFLGQLDERRDAMSTSNVVDDISDVLLEQFSGDKHKRMLNAFGVFCSRHLQAMELYKEHLRKKHVARLMKHIHQLKECNRLTLPDYYTQISQRLAKLVTLLLRLVKKTDSLKLGHTARLRNSSLCLQSLVAAVDEKVADHKNHLELMEVQSHLEISVPKSAKNCNRKEVKCLHLAAQGRRLLKRGEAMWIGHARQLSVQVILVTDMLVLLTERDQKYHLAALQDLKPPAIRLFDLHVRVNASVKSGIQLLLLEQGQFPEMFRLEFSTKRLAKEWEVTLNSAVEDCRVKGLKCEFFGVEKVSLGDESRAEEPEEKDSEADEAEEKQPEAAPDVSPTLRRMQRAQERIELARRILSLSSTTGDGPYYRHAVAGLSKTLASNDSPKNRYRLQQQRPRTTFMDDVEGDVLTSTKTVKPKSNKKARIERSKTFKEKEKEKGGGKDRERERERGGEGGMGEAAEASRIMMEQQYLVCIEQLKDSLVEMMAAYEERDKHTAKLKVELDELRGSINPKTSTASTSRNNSPEGILRKSRLTSSPQQRPHSIHFDLLPVEYGQGSGDEEEEDKEEEEDEKKKGEGGEAEKDEVGREEEEEGGVAAEASDMTDTGLDG